MIVIEGAARLGKTTMAHKIVERSNAHAEYAHMKRPPDDFDWRDDYFKMIQCHLVRDRFHIGGLVWHKQADTGYSVEHAEVVSAKVRAIGGLIVFVVADGTANYGKRYKSLEEGKEGVTHTVEIQVNANEWYKLNAERYADITITLSEWQFPTDEAIDYIIQRWIDRRRYAGSLPS